MFKNFEFNDEVVLPDRQESVIPYVLERHAALHPEAPFAVFLDGEEWSYAETAERTWSLAHQMENKIGVTRGEIVASWVPSGEAAVLSWFATSSLGAIYAPLNTAYKGPQVQHALNLTETKVLIAHASLLERLNGLELPYLETIVVVDGQAEEDSPWQVYGFDELSSRKEVGPPVLDPPLEPWDDCAILMTSGTTGNSKAVRRTYAQYDRYTETTFRLVGADHTDRFYVCAPLFHGGADTPLFSMLQLGASVMIDAGFSASQFWERVRQYDCTIAWLHSSMSLFLHKQPPKADDAENPLKLAMLAPLFPGYQDFAKRFDVRIYMLYGMTEMACPFCVIDPSTVHSLGTSADPGYELRVVDENDIETPPGVPGELVVRHKLPWVISPGYFNDPAATARTWRNGWFHSGDVFVRDEEGNFQLVDRVKDSIRRRGEYVSAAEVEREALDLAEVREAAAIGVSTEMEEEVLLYIALQESADSSPEDIHQKLVERLAYFAVPRFIVMRDSLPRNVALRVDKPALRELGLPTDAWDAAAAGKQPKRERFAMK